MALLVTGYENIGMLLLRLVLALVFLVHAYPKLTNPSAMSKGMKWSTSLVFLLGLLEFLSALSVGLGFFTQVGSLGLVVVMIGALYYKTGKWKISFIGKNTTGWEFDLVILAAAIALLALGAGAYSIDALIGLS